MDVTQNDSSRGLRIEIHMGDIVYSFSKWGARELYEKIGAVLMRRAEVEARLGKV